MEQIKKLNIQILETEKMIASTKIFLESNLNDEILLFMLMQDEELLYSLKEERTKITLDFLHKNVNSASDLLNLFYANTPLVVDTKYIAKELGIRIIKNNELSDNEAGKCYIHEIEKDIVIEYKPQSVIYRENFSIAHEFGHIVKHMSPANNSSFSDSSQLLYARNNYVDSLTPDEREADEFAGYLLIPERSLQLILDELEEDEQISATLIADIYKVSEGTVYHALKSRKLYNNSKISKDFSWL